MTRAGSALAITSAAAGIAAAVLVAASPRAESKPADRAGANVGFTKAAAGAAADVSSNWSGYVANGIGSTGNTASPSMAYTDVTGTWTQPTATCAAGGESTSTALWVGIGGYSTSSQKLEQAGTSVDCDSSGRATYYAWYELVPADSVTIRHLKVNPGDVVTSTVLINGNEVLVQVNNRTRHTSFTKRLTMQQPDLTSAEWIVEAPSLCSGNSCQTLPLADFGSTGFAFATAASAAGQAGTIQSPSWTTTSISLFEGGRRFGGPGSQQGAVTATPGALAYNGSLFPVTFNGGPGAAVVSTNTIPGAKLVHGAPR